MARRRLNVSPNTTSHKAGCTARVSSSVLSRRSFCSSTMLRAPARRTPIATVPTARDQIGCSANASGGAASSTDIAQAPSLVVVAPALVGDLAEHVVEGRTRLAEAGDQLGRRTDHAHRAAVHHGEPVARLLGFIH